jgi:hypothetical protein
MVLGQFSSNFVLKVVIHGLAHHHDHDRRLDLLVLQNRRLISSLDNTKVE